MELKSLTAMFSVACGTIKGLFVLLKKNIYDLIKINFLTWNVSLSSLSYVFPKTLKWAIPKTLKLILRDLGIVSLGLSMEFEIF